MAAKRCTSICTSKIPALSRRHGTRCSFIADPIRGQLANPFALRAISITSTTSQSRFRFRTTAIFEVGGLMRMSNSLPAVCRVVAACGVALLMQGAAGAGSLPNFAPDPTVGWFPNRPTGDDWIPPESGPGPVMPDPRHPYVPNGAGQPTDHVAD